MPELTLPLESGLSVCRIERACSYRSPAKPLSARVAYAAAHVVPKDEGIDWDKTLAFRRHLWSYGLGVAEAMDTAQRGMGLPWESARELIARSLAEAHTSGGLIACAPAPTSFRKVRLCPWLRLSPLTRSSVNGSSVTVAE